MMESVGSRMSEEATVLRESLSMNILIVDDEPSIRETCAEVARQAGMKAFAVASAEEALEVPQGGQQRLETIAALAVRLRETLRRLSQECETRQHPAQ
jgi:CheY-like chemotaxis protein